MRAMNSAKPKLVTAPMGAVSTGRGTTANHWHYVEVVNDELTRVLCGRAKVEHILDDAAMFDTQPATCPHCIRLAAKF